MKNADNTWEWERREGGRNDWVEEGGMSNNKWMIK